MKHPGHTINSNSCWPCLEVTSKRICFVAMDAPTFKALKFNYFLVASSLTFMGCKISLLLTTASLAFLSLAQVLVAHYSLGTACLWWKKPPSPNQF